MLEVVDIRKRFGEIEALAGCSFTVERGRMLGFLGPNGAGKTTTMRAVFGLVPPDAGQVLWDGRTIGVAERLRFGYMPEERGLYPRMRVGEQLVYFGRLHGLAADTSRAAAARWLARLGLEGRGGAKRPVSTLYFRKYTVKVVSGVSERARTRTVATRRPSRKSSRRFATRSKTRTNASRTWG